MNKPLLFTKDDIAAAVDKSVELAARAEVQRQLARSLHRTTPITADEFEERLIRELGIGRPRAKYIATAVQNYALDNHQNVKLERLSYEEVKEVFSGIRQKISVDQFEKLMTGENPGKASGHSPLVAFNLLKMDLLRLFKPSEEVIDDRRIKADFLAKLQKTNLSHNSADVEHIKAYISTIELALGIRFSETELHSLDTPHREFVRSFTAQKAEAMHDLPQEDDHVRIPKSVEGGKAINDIIKEVYQDKASVPDRALRQLALLDLIQSMNAYEPQLDDFTAMLKKCKDLAILKINGKEDHSRLPTEEKQAAILRIYDKIWTSLQEQKWIIPKIDFTTTVRDELQRLESESEKRILCEKDFQNFASTAQTIAIGYDDGKHPGIYLKNSLNKFNTPDQRDAAITLFTQLLGKLGAVNRLYAEREIAPLHSRRMGEASSVAV